MPQGRKTEHRLIGIFPLIGSIMVFIHDNDTLVSEIKYPSVTPKDRRRGSFITITGIILAVSIFLASIYHEFNGPDSPECKAITMFPSYAKMEGFDERYNKLTKKYHIYLYREQGKDLDPLNNGEVQLDGIPVLFIPGNAGSFRQGRSIAAAAANLYFDSGSSIQNSETKNLDFFTADFNEDLTAFHGQTMLDQANYLNDAVRYILMLYGRSTAFKATGRPAPKSVIVIGHSMGGIVARLMVTLENHVHSSINTIITLSSPHSIPPVTFDGDILNLYDKINTFWTAGMQNEESFLRRNTSLISITGGILDETLPADYTGLQDIVPLRNGFTTYTTTIPDVWTPVDHLAIVWCDQLRTVLAKLLLESVDDSVPSKTKDLQTRLKISRRFLLSGLESVASEDNSAYKMKKLTNFELPSETHQKMDQLFIGTKELEMESGRIFRIPATTHNISFNMLTSLETFNLYLCKTNAQVKCIDISKDFVKIPSSFPGSKVASESSTGGNRNPFYFLSYHSDVLDQFDTIYLPKQKLREFDFILAELTTKNLTTVSGNSPFSFLFGERAIKLGPGSFFHKISFPKIWSSLVSYKLVASFDSKSSSLFNPLIRQYIESPFETKWILYDTPGSRDINMHSIAPFIPINEEADSSLQFMVFSPVSANLELSLRINWTLTLKMLFIRYRLAIASFPIWLISLVLLLQFYYYRYNESKFISFESVLVKLIAANTPFFILGLSLLSYLVSFNFPRQALQSLDPFGNNHLLKSGSRTCLYLLGINEPFMLWLPSLFFLMSISLLYLLMRLINIVEFLFVKLWNFSLKQSTVSTFEMSTPPKHYFLMFTKKQLIGILFLATSIFYYIPYQMAFMVVALLQVWAVLKISILYHNQESKYLNLHNFTTSYFILTLFMVPINAPIVLVFLRNAAIRWETSFNSHHNFLAIAPSLLLTLRLLESKNPKISSKYHWTLVLSFVGYLSFYSLLYGIRNLYWVYHLYNIVSGIFFLFTFG